ncbi:MAG TPA: hypothetical protein VNG53_09525 [Bacteroidia bacterium]|nr:hypothetical protein [Bacteroidia bacterium]
MKIRTIHNLSVKNLDAKELYLLFNFFITVSIGCNYHSVGMPESADFTVVLTVFKKHFVLHTTTASVTVTDTVGYKITIIHESINKN